MSSASAKNRPPPQSSKPVTANFASEKLTIGAGVAIFHLASQRVVVCFHSRDRYWFLPKGRRNVGESTEEAAVREGFEESGYRCRLLPLPIPHRQPPSDLDDPEHPTQLVCEPIWTQFVPQSATAQYILFWYAAETLPADVEERLNTQTGATLNNTATTTSQLEPSHVDQISQRRYAAPPAYPSRQSLYDRTEQDRKAPVGGRSVGGSVGTVYEPPRHLGTGVDEEEALYEAYLLPIPDACHKLRGSIMADVVRRGWEAVLLRIRMEDGSA